MDPDIDFGAIFNQFDTLLVGDAELTRLWQAQAIP